MEFISDKNIKDRIFTFDIIDFIFHGREALKIMAIVPGFESFLNEYISEPIFQMFWNDIKERYGKDMDEQELFRVFKFYVFITLLASILEDAKRVMLPLNVIRDRRSYNIYRNENLFDGKLDEETFKELIWKIWEYNQSKEFYEKYVKNKEQKGDSLSNP
jgi:hypothetical protein